MEDTDKIIELYSMRLHERDRDDYKQDVRLALWERYQTLNVRPDWAARKCLDLLRRYYQPMAFSKVNPDSVSTSDEPYDLVMFADSLSRACQDYIRFRRQLSNDRATQILLGLSKRDLHRIKRELKQALHSLGVSERLTKKLC